MRDKGIEITVATGDFDENSSSKVEDFYKAVGKEGIPFIRPAYYSSGGLDFWSRLEVARKKLKSLAKLSAKYGPKTLLHNHYGPLLTCSCLGARMLADTCDPKNVGIYIDFAHLSLNGEPFEMAFGICGEYLSLVGVKANRYVTSGRDEKGKLQYRIEWLTLKDGITNWTQAIRLLKQLRYNGPYVFHAEYTAHEKAAELVVQDRDFLTKIVDGK
jgi:sugar phosphate isomerase/epimerase